MAWEEGKPKLGICIPMLGKVSIEWAVNFSRLCSYIRVPFRYYLNKHFRIDVARNRLVKDALKDGCDRILFIDTDIYPCTYRDGKFYYRPDAVYVLWQNHYPIVSACYWSKKNCPALYELEDPKAKKPFRILYVDIEEIANEVFYVDAVGLGFCLIERKIFEEIDYPWFEYRVDYDFDAEEEREISEDLSFFMKVKEAIPDMKVLVDGRVICKHEAEVHLTWGGRCEWVVLSD